MSLMAKQGEVSAVAWMRKWDSVAVRNNRNKCVVGRLQCCHRAKSEIDWLWWLQQEATQQITEQRQADTDSGSRQPDLAFKNCRDLKPTHLVCLSVCGTYRTLPTQTPSFWFPIIPSIAACRDALDSVRVSSCLYLSLCFQWYWCIPTLIVHEEPNFCPCKGLQTRLILGS